MLERPAGGAAPAPDPWARLIPIMQAHGVKVEPPEFFAAVNRAFHAGGAGSYDEVNRSLWDSLPEQFQSLVSDFLQQYPPPNHRMNALDIGCGTGMSSEMILETRFGPFIRQIDLVDPVEEMLQVCAMRHSLLGIRHRLIRGEIGKLAGQARYDLVFAGCVLQHVADLPDFLRHLAMRQPAGGIFLHLQDPNGDSMDDPEQRRRVAQLAKSRHGLMNRLSRRWNRSGPPPHVETVNRELASRAIVATPLTQSEIAAVVRLRSQDGYGISLRRLQSLLPDYRMVASRSYAFFGSLASVLPPQYRRREHALMAERANNGCQVGAVWVKTK
jgi:trans-aconitate methyltransferase